MKNKAANIRAAILQADDLKFEDLEIFGVKVRINEISAAQGEAFNEATRDFSGAKKLAALVVWTATDPESGEAVFKQSDVEALMEKSEITILRMAETAMILNHMKEPKEGESENLA